MITPTVTSTQTTTSPATIDDLVITAQEGRSVEACFSYDSNKMSVLVENGQAEHGHHCNCAEFNVSLSGSQVGMINLNNAEEGTGCILSGGGMGGMGGMGGGMGGFEGPSVSGGSFSGKWINGKFDVQISCALSICHSDVTFLSIIGEVVTTSGKIMWLKIDQGMIYPDQKYEYAFKEFSLTDVKPTFGTYCELQ